MAANVEGDPSTDEEGWAWFDRGDAPEADRALGEAFARCFRDHDGEAVLDHLRAATLERALGPGATDAQLRHLEGQRQLVSHIINLVERGRAGG
ncbi:MAG: hypothetical protein HYS64_08355 [Rhodospirillales bacterium]|nr:hypothetical protein [Rhodospirillales bacterium]